MHIDARTLENNTLINGDLCIIGAGAAGISIAREFMDTPYKVILLESGGFDYDEETQSLYEGKNIGLPYFSLDQARLRFFGGSTNHWNGMCAPLDPIDFEKRDWIPYSGWPISGKEHQVLSRYYVLACGAIENARLLLVSNQIERDGLGNRHDLVGRFFMEHIHVGSARLLVSASFPLQYVADIGFQEKVHLRVSEQLQRKRKLLNCAFDLYATDLFPSDYFDYSQHEVSKEEIKLYLSALQTLKDNFWVDKRDRLQRSADPIGVGTRELIVFAALEQVPNPASRVTLDRDKDKLGIHKSLLDWRFTDLERRTIEEATHLMGYEIGRSQLGRLQIFDWLTQETHAWPQFPEVLRGGYHHMGTTRMSDNPKTGVVNSNCQVYGVSNLYIAGSSVYPTAGTANPTLTLVALAIRLAEHLKGLL